MLKLKKKAFIVVGPESSGTRMLTEILIKAGCHGQSTHKQLYDTFISGKESPIVWRRSVPHGRKMPNINEMHDQLLKLEYEVTVLVIVRSFIPNAKSQVKRKHVSNEEAGYASIQRAMRHITEHIQKASATSYTLTYESLYANDKAIPTILSFLQLNSHIDFNMKNEDAKYYEEE